MMEKLGTIDPGSVVLCSIVKAELYYGAYRSQRREDNLALLAKFFSAFSTLAFDEKCEDAYGLVRAELTRTGNLIGPNDLLIAAIALANSAVLVANNIREFSRLPNLQLEDWEE